MRVAAALLLSSVLQASATECLKAGADPQIVEGKLERITFVDEAYERTEKAFILVLAKPACLTGEDEYDHVESSPRIHVFSMDDKILRQLRLSIGGTIRVKGYPFGEQTAHHHAPIVMNVSEILRR